MYLLHFRLNLDCQALMVVPNGERYLHTISRLHYIWCTKKASVLDVTVSIIRCYEFKRSKMAMWTRQKGDICFFFLHFEDALATAFSKGQKSSKIQSPVLRVDVFY